MSDRYGALTDKEKQTLRLIVRGHDAKSIARHFDLSVHTINERLRDARRKLSVSSSREAARLLAEQERVPPEPFADEQIGAAVSRGDMGQHVDPEAGPTWPRRRVWITAGVAFMSLALAAVALLSGLQPEASPQTATSAASPVAPDAEVEASARRWLALVDQQLWEESWKGTGAQFRELNTAEVWASASERARTPLGAMLSRVAISQEDVPAPPRGYSMIKFRTSFANKPDAVETLSLAREDGAWRVVGIFID